MASGDNAGLAASRRSRLAEWAPLLVVVLAIWLAWRIMLVPIVQRAPPEVSLRLAPGSTTALSRAAEIEYAAGRFENARLAAASTLAAKPFDVRALRVFGLTEAKAGRLDQADSILTLSGNWSLRDSASHGWLVDRRLRQGSYSSAFAHADTLARRRPALQPQVFRLFTAATGADSRAVPPLARLLAISPPWRTPFIDSLYEQDDRPALQAALALSLQRTPAPLTDRELRQLYIHWLEAGRIQGLKALRERLGRPAAALTVVDGSFDGAPGPEPFSWTLLSSPGISAEITADDLNPDAKALRVDYDGYASGVMTQQLLLLAPGPYVLAGDARLEAGGDEPRMAWTVICFDTGAVAGVVKSPAGATPGGVWSSFSGAINIPASGCSAQWLRLAGLPDDRRRSTVEWFDNITVKVRRGSI